MLQIVTERPQNMTFTPGQATKISINESGWKDKKRPFTFTSLPNDPFLEFIIKTYPSSDFFIPGMKWVTINSSLPTKPAMTLYSHRS
ncbi:MAG: hypothetical protein K9J16_19025 [Melioribacteraceae bacterium]|nr:hypothetical protein [Melioribacteraceae bacterium]